ncbi:MAG: hypothetical protein ACRCTI_04970 [Beijerinckiaceae bacterium]
MFFRTAAAPFLAAALFGLVAVAPAAAEQGVQNPLRPRAEDSRRAKPAEERRDDTAAKPRRERSAKQRQNDDIMRSCGAEWRAEKASLQAKGETWRSFLKDCRAKKKAETPV